MSEASIKHPRNAPGKYYVDCDTCLDHELCVEAAPNNFKMDREMWAVAYVFKQPSNSEEEAQCRKAMEECPVEAIHDNG